MSVGYASAEMAAEELAERGYTIHYDTGECGDNGYGSRLYYRRPEEVPNRFGCFQRHATISFACGRYHTSYFGEPA